MAHHYKYKVLQGYKVKIETAREKKHEYAGHWSSQAEPTSQGERGNVKVVRGPWNEAFFSEAEAFPTKGVHDDQIDACSAAFRRVSDSNLSRLRALARM